ncbi:helix-turn-helix domain-containing protein [Sphingomonas sp. RG327]|uniref:Helix-turn-helix domain-containing protein n=1 Tax=Sphingomonas anseongensis TaxID=2908207 RepID=A0ABT0RFE5_9SPHN|nr:helix-turn-helix domain-containing protein [Sphingomonas anseongensis]MCL6678992.1 helix-turn-helix domain-containing protein [Sphingomonas anseongensis]
MLYSINETAGALRLGRTSIYNFIKKGRLQTVKLGRRRLVTASSIKALIGESEVAQ